MVLKSVLCPCLVMVLLVVKVNMAAGFPMTRVVVGSRDGYEVNCHHTAAKGITPEGMQLWWYRNGKMKQVASVTNDNTEVDPDFPGKAVGLQLGGTTMLSVKVTSPTEAELGSYICTLLYKNEKGSTKSAVVDYINFVPAH